MRTDVAPGRGKIARRDLRRSTKGRWRSSALEDNLRLYRVVDGDRQQLAWDGQVTLEAEDSTFARGKLGLWTKADSISRFDDLEAIAD